MNTSDRIFVAGHRGLVGSAIVRRLKALGYSNLIEEACDELSDASEVHSFLFTHEPAYIFLAAAAVGGIEANRTKPVPFILANLLIQANVIATAHAIGVKKILFLGSSCIYPRECPQPIREDYLMTGPLEPTNSAYAMAKLAGIEMLDAYRKQYGFRSVSVMPTNLYGPGDSFDLETCHVLPALIRRFHEAKLTNAPEVILWGSGTPRREFMHVDDCADACIKLMNEYDEPGIINVGVGHDNEIRDIAGLVAGIVGYTGRILFDATKPDGMPRKLLDVSKLHGLGWEPKIRLGEGLESTYRWYVENLAKGTVRGVNA